MGSERLYLGVDVGGTKVQASMIGESGAVLNREKCATPRGAEPEETLAAIEAAMRKVLKTTGNEVKDLTAIGIAIPGVVDPAAGHIVVTPNMNLTGINIGAHLHERFKVPVALGNDCNLGALGESWLGSAREADSVLAMLVGTGIGGGFVQNGNLWCGAREAASEIGHIVMQIGGPKCGCGNHGCLEALASRSAIERDINEAVAAGRQTVLTELIGADLSIIRSGMLRRALARDDEIVTEVMGRAAEVIGYACLTIRHLLDPEVIVLGGGVVEACSDFILPIVEKVVASDSLAGAREGGNVLLSALGDDAVVVGAVALARTLVGRSPFKKKFTLKTEYPEIKKVKSGKINVDGEQYDRDIFIRVDGKIKKRDKAMAESLYGNSHTVGPEELEKVCKGGPQVLFLGTGMSDSLRLTEEAERFLAQRAIKCEALPTAELGEAYNASRQRKAALIHVTC